MSSLSISRAWEETRRILRRDSRLFAALALAFAGFPAIVSTAIMPEAAPFQEQSAGQSAIMLAVLVMALIGQMAMTRMALSPPTTVGAAIAHALRRFPYQLLAILLMILALFGLAIVVGGFAAAMGAKVGGGAPPTISGPLALVVLIALGIVLWVAVRMVLLTPVAVAEEIGPIAILTRSWALSKGNFGRLLLLTATLLVALVVASLAVAAVVGSVVMMAFGRPEPMSGAALLLGLAQGVLSAAFAVLSVLMITRVYVQLSGNDRVEGVGR